MRLVADKRRRVWLAAGAILIACGISAAVAIALHRAQPEPNDCDVVAEMATQWTSTVGSITSALEAGPGEREDLLTVADSEMELAKKLRASAAVVSDPAIKANLYQWAEGATLLAQSQRNTANQPSRDINSPVDPDFVKGSETAALASSALLQACPNARSD